MNKRLLFAVAVGLLLGPLANAGIIRHVVRPVARTSARVVAKTAKTTVHVAKTVIY
jgi:hypothetical protein